MIQAMLVTEEVVLTEGVQDLEMVQVVHVSEGVNVV